MRMKPLQHNVLPILVLLFSKSRAFHPAALVWYTEERTSIFLGKRVSLLASSKGGKKEQRPCCGTF